VIPAKDMNLTQVRELQKADVWVFGDVADDEMLWRDYLALGVDSILSNKPDALIAYLKQNGARN
jgi:hypothetical protein